LKRIEGGYQTGIFFPGSLISIDPATVANPNPLRQKKLKKAFQCSRKAISNGIDEIFPLPERPANLKTG